MVAGKIQVNHANTEAMAQIRNVSIYWVYWAPAAPSGYYKSNWYDGGSVSIKAN